MNYFVVKCLARFWLWGSRARDTAVLELSRCHDTMEIHCTMPEENSHG